MRQGGQAVHGTTPVLVTSTFHRPRAASRACRSVCSWLLMRTKVCPVWAARYATRLVLPLLVGPCTRGRRVWQGGRASGLAAQAVLAELLVKRQQVHRGSARGQHAPHEIASSAQLRQLR